MKINLKWRVLDLHNRKKEEKEKEHAPDYRKYTFSRKEILLYGAQGVGIAALLAWFFYHSFWAVLPLSPLILFTFKETEKTLIRRQTQFCLSQQGCRQDTPLKMPSLKREKIWNVFMVMTV